MEKKRNAARIKSPYKIFKNGYLPFQLELPNKKIMEWIMAKNWKELDRFIGELTQPKGSIFQLAKNIIPIKDSEYILALRQAPDEDGIWHDDGSRILAFTLSLNAQPESIDGGELELRKKGEQDIQRFPIFPFGHGLFFLTGVHDFEHRVCKVIHGQRIIAAGWFT
jgi:hypothetical protein